MGPVHSELEQLRSLVGPTNVLQGREDLLFYGRDSCKEFEANPCAIILPSSVSEVSAVLGYCNDNGIAVVPSGGRTGYSGGATACNGELVLSLARMQKILWVSKADQALCCEVGATTEAVRQRAEQEGLYYPMDFASKGSSHIGGNIATNAGGIRVIRYGSTRAWVLGLKVVVADGGVLTLNGCLYKNQSGYDLRSLFIGSEGTLGIIVEATLQLTSPPQDSVLACVALQESQAALEVLVALRDKGLLVNVFEYLERNALELVLKSFQALRDPFHQRSFAYLVIEVEESAPLTRSQFEAELMRLLDVGTVADVVLASSAKQAQDLMALRENISEAILKHFVPHKNDISVPISHIPTFLAELKQELARRYPHFEVITFGHVGDGNLHVNILKPASMELGEFRKVCAEADGAVFELVSKHAGSISAEHGVGLLKKNYVRYTHSDEEVAYMRQMKRVFDPKGILNPGKVI